MKKTIGLLTLVLLLAGLAMACGEPEKVIPTQPGTLTIAGSWEDCKAIESLGRDFSEKYPDCTVEYEYLQDYYTALEKRMTGSDTVDLFFTTNIQEDSPMLPYAVDLYSCEELDLSETFEGLLKNFAFREEGTEPTRLYAIPLGAEMRGLYINKTLLESLNIEVPTDQESLLDACEVLKENGYIPFHGNPGDFGQTLLYPWICNLIANAEDPQEAFRSVNSREAGVSEMLREPFEFLYTLVENGYYDYKRAQTELNLFNDSTDQDYARYFLSICAVGDEWEKADDVGQVAFMPSPISLQNVIEKTRDDYHSHIEYVFVPAPVGPDGGYAYLSPAHGIAINNNSPDQEWSVLFLDYLFRSENNERFSEEFHIIPNTKEAFDYISGLYEIPGDRICHLGQVTFDYGFYNITEDSLLETSKANNPKYMMQNEDGTTSLYPLKYYLDHYEESITGNE